jgi:hypothetical protein
MTNGENLIFRFRFFVSGFSGSCKRSAAESLGFLEHEPENLKCPPPIGGFVTSTAEVGSMGYATCNSKRDARHHSCIGPTDARSARHREGGMTPGDQLRLCRPAQACVLLAGPMPVRSHRTAPWGTRIPHPLSRENPRTRICPGKAPYWPIGANKRSDAGSSELLSSWGFDQPPVAGYDIRLVGAPYRPIARQPSMNPARTSV